MSSNLRILILLAVILSGCQKREWQNPFDPNCPKEIWTPTDFTAVQEGTSINLTWSQSITQISGFHIQKSVSGGLTSFPDKSVVVNHLVDSNLTGGVIITYSITAFAGNNLSNTVTVQITPVFAPVVATALITVVTTTNATCGGTITSDGGTTITAKGVCWSKTSNPTIASNKTNDGAGSGGFTSSITGLISDTTYFVRAYAINSVGVAYGQQIPFNASIGTVLDADLNIYHSVTIGTQVWLSSNLKTTHFNNGDPIPYFTASYNHGYCWYNDDINNKNPNGAIYNYNTAMDTRGICPIGWHLPTSVEWETLSTFLGGDNISGGKLKEAGTVHWLSPNIGATNESGFSALPSGEKDCASKFVNMGVSTQFWVSAPDISGDITSVTLSYSNTQLTVGSGGFDCNNYSVRCVKN